MKRRTSSYDKKLQHPNWQKKRLQVLERSGWRCEWCGNGQENLQVHHGWYPAKKKGRDPWEVPENVLYCLCDRCHERAEVARQSLLLEVGRIHPRHHWYVRKVLLDVQELVRTSPERLAELYEGDED